MYSIVIQYFCRLYSIIDYYKILNIVPSSILCIVAYQDLYANSSHQFVSSSFLHPLVIKNFIISMSFYIYIHLYYFLGYIYVLSCSICLSFSYLFYLLYSWSVYGASNSSVIFCFWVIFHCIYTMYVYIYIYIYICIYIYIYHIILIHSPVDGDLGCFHVFAFVNIDVMKLGSMYLFWIYTEVETAGSYGSSIFTLSNLCTVFCSVCNTNLYSPQQCIFGLPW